MMKTKTSFWLAAALAAGFTMGFAGCGDTMMMMPTTCSSDSACSTGQACHPILRTCVTACTSGTDCPDSAKTCATFTGLAAGNDAGVRAFCQCGTDQLCDRGTAGQVCQPATKICAAKCTSNAGCPSGATCDTATGKCGAAVATDAGTDGGTGGTDAGVCTPGSCTTAGQICDPTTQQCGAPAACSSANPQPDTCVYGLLCAGAACAEAPRSGVTCSNFDNVATPKAWNPATVTPKGAVTTAFGPRATNDNTACTGARPDAFTFTVDLYAPPMSTFPSMLEMNQAMTFNYVTTDGMIIDLANPLGPIRPMSGYAMNLANNNKNVRIVWTGCTAAGLTSLRAGFFANGGNPNCATQTR
ncbi:MAG: hypothetical protein Q8N26_02095 [Myxococcales bacterium]|nr:hypothetical protein [Myxococcales bacterium]